MFVSEDPHASYKLLERELTTRGFWVQTKVIDNRHVMIVDGKKGERWVTRTAHISYPMTPSFSKQISDEKNLAYAMMNIENIPTPLTKVVDSEEQLSEQDADALFDVCKVLVVKPADSSLSRGLTLNISTYQALVDAIESARTFSASGKVIVQQQVSGEEVRFVFLHGRIRAALLRETAKITGDGKQTVSELIARENDDRATIDSMVSYPQLSDEHFDRPIDLKYVPLPNEKIELNRSTMIAKGASVYNILEDIHPSYIEMAEKAARTIGTDFVVIDMLIQDHTNPFKDGNAYFNEFNGAPVLKLFYSCRDGNNVDILPLLVDAIERRIRNDED